MARLAREYLLLDCGCKNSIAVGCLGHVDSTGTRCEFGLCAREEVQQRDSETLALEEYLERARATLKFKSPGGKDEEFVFFYKPLGVDFSTEQKDKPEGEQPLEILKLSNPDVRSEASKHGLCKGYVLTEINGKSIQGLTWNAAWSILVDAVMALPVKPDDYVSENLPWLRQPKQ
eukprot:TRINITY_DN54493_c0_g1_i1.p1 TRINITY_DN54493_c0_g1~~TRINITY_DN54493_c0_g1_i1.p1  ORF type:complete len:204 (-),score=30.78 TRINITY_DN54493_c0_g1_i1:55-579(-)